MHLKKPGSLDKSGFTFIVLVTPLLKTKKELKSLCRLEIQTSFTEMSFIKPVFNTIWHMVYQRI